MKNKHLKNALISAGLAVFAGVLLLGANAAIGAAPTHPPPGTGIAPTFTGLTVTGDVEVDGGLYANGSIETGGDYYGNSIDVGAGDVDGNLNVGGNVNITEDIILGGEISPAGSHVDIAGGVNVDGASSFFNSVTFGDVINTDTISGITGLNIDNVENIDAGINNNLSISTSGAYAPFIYLNPDNGRVWISSEDLDIDGDVVINDNLVVNDTVQADKFGNFTERYSGWISIPAGANQSISQACNIGEYVVSCGNDLWTAGDIVLNNVQPITSSQSCWMEVTNTAGGARWVRAVAMCWDPDGL
ncbi:hypothetical protein GF366_03575 [Candidatus Peregrinibacteria bacterium]|nr:hypothetical protein [Candidatus Peregrinibacteria bacterium]